MEKDRRVTIADVARAANVSRTLVSFVLNGRADVSAATRARILQAIEDLNYRPNAVARNLARRRAGTIGIVCDIETYQDALDMQFLAAILTAAAERKQRVMLIPADDRQVQEVAQDHAVDGMIFLDERIADPSIAHLQEINFSAVGIWNDHLDDVLLKGLEELALHIESRGHQRAICLCGPSDRLFSLKFEEIAVAALQKYGIETASCYCSPQNETGIVHDLVRAIRENHATVVVASSDRLAISTIHSLATVHLHVPDDCAVTGFGDTPSARLVQPQLTTLRIPVRELANRAVSRVLKDETSHQPGAQFAALQGIAGSRLVVRRSC